MTVPAPHASSLAHGATLGSRRFLLRLLSLFCLAIVATLPAPAEPIPDFAYLAPTEPAPALTDAFSFDPTLPAHFWGNHSRPTAAALDWSSTPFVLTNPWLVVPVLGSPTVEVFVETIALSDSAQDTRVATATWSLNASDAMPRWRVFDVADLVGRPAVLSVRAPPTTAPRAFALAAPHFAPDLAAAQDVAHRAQTDYRNDSTYFSRVLAVTAALLGLPLLLAIFYRRRGATFTLATLAVLLAWALAGLLHWLGAPALAAPLATTLWGLGLAAAALAIPAAVWCIRDLYGPALVALYLAAVAGAHLATVPDFPVLGESGQNNPLRARMVASPPDNFIPWSTAIYFHHGKDGRADRALYFGAEWAVTSRGPLLPLIITAVFVARDHRPHDPPYPAERRWPADDEGVYLARAVAIALNALLLPALVALARTFGATPRAALLAGAGLALTPFFNENLAFTWPKLLAATGVILATLLIRTGPRWAWPPLLTLAYFAHPLALLFAPALVLYEGARRDRLTPRALVSTILLRAVPVLALLAPWWLYKAWVGHPDAMLGYVLGDGRGFARADSLASWFTARAANAAHTFLPGYWWFTGSPFYWFDDWIDGGARWAVHAGRSLWAQLGTVLGLGVAVTLWRSRRALAPELLYLVLPATLTLLVFWGFSRDGLGRQCLEPLTALVLVLAAAHWTPHAAWLGWALLAGAMELTFLRLSSFAWAELVRPDFLWLPDLTYVAAAVLVWLAIAFTYRLTPATTP